MNAPITRPALRYHGAKFRLAPWVMSFFPEHRIYTEAYGGAAGVLIRKPRSHGEVYNDLDGDVVNFFRCLRDIEKRRRLIELLKLTPYSRADFDEAWLPTDDDVERARRLAIRAQMGFGSAGATKGTTGLRSDTKREYSTAQQDWASYPDSLAAVGERFSCVLVENRPAVDVLQQHDSPETLHFVDPPYVHSTRVLRARGGYRHELDDEQHADLLSALKTLSGMVVLSGYANPLYDTELSDWQRADTSARISAGRGTAVRQESVWLNPACAKALESGVNQLRLVV